MDTTNRPISPHLQVYRWQLTMALSIVHRATGVALVVGTLVLAYWVIAVAAGPGAYTGARALLGSWYGQILLFGWSFCLFYHLCNGIRHLFWDVGIGFELRTADLSGLAVLIASAALTLVTWIAALSMDAGGVAA